MIGIISLILCEEILLTYKATTGGLWLKILSNMVALLIQYESLIAYEE